MTQPIDVQVREVGMRDGLQSIQAIMATADKQAWCRTEHAAGVAEIEVCSLVPPRLLPQFGDAAEVVAFALQQPGLTVSALIPNLKGAERGIALGVHKMNYAMSVSEGHNQANVRRSVADSVADFGRIVERLRQVPEASRPRLAGGLATAFGCSIEGRVAEDRVVELALRLAELGADEVVVADTVGYGNPAAVRRVFRRVKRELGALPLGAHFHDTRGLGLANVLAALDAGVDRFDSSLGGFGGCPYAPGATGNIATDGLVFLLQSMGLETGIDLARLLPVVGWLKGKLPGVDFPSAIAIAGLPKNFVPAGGPTLQEAV
ncbi:MAG: hydroxymethylglutaryl-CoA lyase [Alphaproteobacteria bacterium]|nr:hydroxymethylglutaryl-CoA lyase [Alphaproteobacteria bacterium]